MTTLFAPSQERYANYISPSEMLALIVATVCNYKDTVTVVKNEHFVTDGQLHASEFDTEPRAIGFTEYTVSIVPNADLVDRFFKFVGTSSDAYTVRNEVSRIFNNASQGVYSKLLDIISHYDIAEHQRVYQLVLDKGKSSFNAKLDKLVLHHLRQLYQFARLCREIVLECTSSMPQNARVLGCTAVFKNSALIVNLQMRVYSDTTKELTTSGVHLNMPEQQETVLAAALQNKDPRIMALFDSVSEMN